MPNPLRSCLAVTLAVTFGLCSTRADDVEGVKETLFQAKKEYDGEVGKFRAAVTEALDRREDVARKVGNKKALDEVKGDRDRFENGGEPPSATPPALLARAKRARAKLDKAYATAVKELVILKEDAAAEAVEKEQQKFQLDTAVQFGKKSYLIRLKHFDVKVHGGDGFANNGTVGVIKYKKDGELVPHSIFTHPSPNGAAQVSYPLGGKWTVFHAAVGIPTVEEKTGDPEVGMLFDVLADGEVIWTSEPVTKIDTFQTVTVRVSGVKTLTLRVRSPGNNAWARTVWFEPILVE